MKPAIFLDRDGVIIENRSDYVRSWDDVSFYPQALSVLAQIARLPYSVVLVTNQSAVGRGIVPLETAWTINRQVVEVVKQSGGRIDRVYMCPHAPWEGCTCRKPKPGLLLQAASELGLDLDRSLMIGDALTDLYAAAAAGVPRAALVRTGRGITQEQLAEAQNMQNLSVHPDLSNALKTMLVL